MSVASTSSVTTGVWKRLSSSCRDAFSWAAAFDTNIPPVVFSETLLLGIIRAHRWDSEPEVLLRHYGRTAADLEDMVRRRSPQLQYAATNPASLTDVPTLSPNAQLALDATLQFFDRYPRSDGIVPLRYLFGGLLFVESSVAYQVLGEVLGGVDLGAIAISY